MRVFKWFYIICLVVFVTFLQRHSVAQEPGPTPSRATVTVTDSPDITELNLIHFGDLIEVDVVGSVEFDWRGTLNPEGFLDRLENVEEPVMGLCRTEAEVAKAVAKGLRKFLRDPQVVVRILDRSNRPVVTVYGAVRTPQRFQVKREVYLSELIVLTGGFTEKASGEIQVFRPKSLSCNVNEESRRSALEGANRETYLRASENNGSLFIDIKISELLQGKTEANLQLLSGDVVTVLEARPVYVIGGVAAPRQIATRSEITVSRAIASAGGLTKDAEEQKVIIFRRSGGNSSVIEVDLAKIRAKQAEDLVLQAFDIVDVSQKGRDKRKYAPYIRFEDPSEQSGITLPLRVID